jgi:hypothetical protein
MRVVRLGCRALPKGLSQRERLRLIAVTAHRGLDMTRKMYVSFRLARMQSAVPLTFQLIGERLRNSELSRYLQTHRPTSFYYVDEGRRLLTYLRSRLRTGALAVPYLVDVIAYEAGLLTMKEARDRRANTKVHIRVEHDVEAITRSLEAGKRPKRIAARPTVIVGTVRDGDIDLEMHKGGGNA